MKVFSWNDVAVGAESRAAASLGLASASNSAAAVCVGGFDGAHLGHQAIFDAVFEWNFWKKEPLIFA